MCLRYTANQHEFAVYVDVRLVRSLSDPHFQKVYFFPVPEMRNVP